MRKILTILTICLCLTVFTGCANKNINSTNPAVIQAATLSDAEKTVNTIAHGLLAADQTLDSIKSTETDYYAAVQPKIKTIVNLNEVANQCIITALKGGTCDWKTSVIAIAVEAGSPDNLTSFGFKNPATKQKVQLGFQAFITGINLAIQFQQKAGQ